jgi:hypothetical protein
VANSLHRVLRAAADAMGTKKACIYMSGLFLTGTLAPRGAKAYMVSVHGGSTTRAWVTRH